MAFAGNAELFEIMLVRDAEYRFQIITAHQFRLKMGLSMQRQLQKHEILAFHAYMNK